MLRSWKNALEQLRAAGVLNETDITRCYVCGDDLRANQEVCVCVAYNQPGFPLVVIHNDILHFQSGKMEH